MKQTKINNTIILYTNTTDSRTYIVNRVNNTIKSTTSDCNNSYTLALMVLGLVKLQCITNNAIMPVGQLEFNSDLTVAA